MKKFVVAYSSEPYDMELFIVEELTEERAILHVLKEKEWGINESLTFQEIIDECCDITVKAIEI